MDKNSWIGLLLIMAILLGWSYYTRPSEEEIQRMRERRDSIARVEQQRQLEIELQKSQAAEQAQIISPEASDSAASEMLRKRDASQPVWRVCRLRHR